MDILTFIKKHDLLKIFQIINNIVDDLKTLQKIDFIIQYKICHL